MSMKPTSPATSSGVASDVFTVANKDSSQWSKNRKLAKFLDADPSVSTWKRLKSVINFCVDTSPTEINQFFNDNYSTLYNHILDCLHQANNEGTKKSKDDQLTDADILEVLNLLGKLLDAVSAKIKLRWQCRSITNVLIELLQHGNKYLVRAKGMQLLLKFIAILTTSVDATILNLFAGVINFPLFIESNNITATDKTQLENYFSGHTLNNKSQYTWAVEALDAQNSLAIRRGDNLKLFDQILSFVININGPELFSFWLNLLRNSILIVLYPAVLLREASTANGPNNPSNNAVPDKTANLVEARQLSCGFRPLAPSPFQFLVISWLLRAFTNPVQFELCCFDAGNFPLVTEIMRQSWFLLEKDMANYHNTLYDIIKIYKHWLQKEYLTNYIIINYNSVVLQLFQHTQAVWEQLNQLNNGGSKEFIRIAQKLVEFYSIAAKQEYIAQNSVLYNELLISIISAANNSIVNSIEDLINNSLSVLLDCYLQNSNLTQSQWLRLSENIQKNHWINNKTVIESWKTKLNLYTKEVLNLLALENLPLSSNSGEKSGIGGSTASNLSQNSQENNDPAHNRSESGHLSPPAPPRFSEESEGNKPTNLSLMFTKQNSSSFSKSTPNIPPNSANNSSADNTKFKNLFGGFQSVGGEAAATATANNLANSSNISANHPPPEPNHYNSIDSTALRGCSPILQFFKGPDPTTVEALSLNPAAVAAQINGNSNGGIAGGLNTRSSGNASAAIAASSKGNVVKPPAAAVIINKTSNSGSTAAATAANLGFPGQNGANSAANSPQSPHTTRSFAASFQLWLVLLQLFGSPSFENAPTADSSKIHNSTNNANYVHFGAILDSLLQLLYCAEKPLASKKEKLQANSDNLVEIRRKFLPQNETIMKIYGKWLIQAANHVISSKSSADSSQTGKIRAINYQNNVISSYSSDSLVDRGASIAVLCKLLCSRCDSGYSARSLAQFYSILSAALHSKQPDLVFCVLKNSKNLFSLSLPGVSALISSFFTAISAVLTDKNSPISIKLASLTIIQSWLIRFYSETEEFAQISLKNDVLALFGAVLASESDKFIVNQCLWGLHTLLQYELAVENPEKTRKTVANIIETVFRPLKQNNPSATHITVEILLVMSHFSKQLQLFPAEKGNFCDRILSELIESGRNWLNDYNFSIKSLITGNLEAIRLTQQQNLTGDSQNRELQPQQQNNSGQNNAEQLERLAKLISAVIYTLLEWIMAYPAILLGSGAEVTEIRSKLLEFLYSALISRSVTITTIKVELTAVNLAVQRVQNQHLQALATSGLSVNLHAFGVSEEEFLGFKGEDMIPGQLTIKGNEKSPENHASLQVSNGVANIHVETAGLENSPMSTSYLSSALELEESAAIALRHMINRCGHFPLPNHGPEQITSTVNEPNFDGEEGKEGKEGPAKGTISKESNVLHFVLDGVSIISCYDLDNSEKLACRLVIRDLTGKYCWDFLSQQEFSEPKYSLLNTQAVKHQLQLKYLHQIAKQRKKFEKLRSYPAELPILPQKNPPISKATSLTFTPSPARPVNHAAVLSTINSAPDPSALLINNAVAVVEPRSSTAADSAPGKVSVVTLTKPLIEGAVASLVSHFARPALPTRAAPSAPPRALSPVSFAPIPAENSPISSPSHQSEESAELAGIPTRHLEEAPPFLPPVLMLPMVEKASERLEKEEIQENKGREKDSIAELFNYVKNHYNSDDLLSKTALKLHIKRLEKQAKLAEQPKDEKIAMESAKILDNKENILQINCYVPNSTQNSATNDKFNLNKASEGSLVASSVPNKSLLGSSAVRMSFNESEEAAVQLPEFNNLEIIDSYQPRGANYRDSGPTALKKAPSKQLNLPGFTANSSELPSKLSAFDFVRSLLSNLYLGFDFSGSSLVHIEDSAKLRRSIKLLDTNPVRECHKIGVIYVARGQDNQRAIMMNSSGSKLYEEFLQGLGWIINVEQHLGFLGGLEWKSTGPHSIYWANSLYECMFHVVTMMPTKPKQLDPQQIHKKRQVGNDHVHIVWSEHSRDYRPSTISSEFNDAHIVIYPFASNSPHSPQLFRIQIHAKASVPLFGPLLDGQIVPWNLLAVLVRLTALNANRAIRYSTTGYGRPYPTRKKYLDDCIGKVLSEKKQNSTTYLMQHLFQQRANSEATNSAAANAANSNANRK
jgi:hypothetical protein